MSTSTPPTPASWRITESAIDRYLHARHWRATHASTRHTAKAELERMKSAARYRRTDRFGRELWRSPSSKTGGNGMRWVIDTRDADDPSELAECPRVIWVGFGAPPLHVWAER